MSGTDRIKLRGSLGYTGNASFSPYQAMTTYKYDAGLDYDKGIGAIPMAIGNPDLKWERALTYNVGLDVVLRWSIITRQQIICCWMWQRLLPWERRRQRKIWVNY